MNNASISRNVHDPVFSDCDEAYAPDVSIDGARSEDRY